LRSSVGPTGLLRRERAKAAIVGVLTIGLALSLALNLPGHLSYDSIMQLWQGRTGVYNTWHPPVMAWLLGVFDRVVPGAGLFVVFDSLMLYGGFAALALLRPLPSWWALPLALLWIASPQGLIYPAIVWKDVLFAGAMLCGFCTLAWSEARWNDVRSRNLLVGAAVVFWSLAALARQNGVLVPIFGVCGLFFVAARNGAPGRLKRAAAYGGAGAAACGVIIALASAVLAAHSDGEPSQRYQLEDLQIYDLAAAVAADPSLPLDVLHRKNPQLERLVRTRAAAAYSPQRIDAIQSLTTLEEVVSSTPEAVTGAQWRELILRHPALYLKVRLASFGWLILTPELDQCLPVYVGVDGPQPWLGRLGLATRTRPQDNGLENYAERFADTPVYSHLAYALTGAGLFVWLLLRRRPGDLAIAALLAAALAFTASFFVISLSCDYRYLYALDVSVLAAGFYAALGRGEASSD
jgi:hypothetical protein